MVNRLSTAFYIGTSGWHYDHWRGIFYPDKLQKTYWLDFYSRHFNTVEINASFYRLPSENTFTTWHNTVFPEFCFALKASRFITHIKKLKDIREPLLTFTQRALNLKNNLGPVLYQLPPGLHRDNGLLESFIALLDPNLRHVIEFRHQSWIDQSVFDLLRRYNIGFCIFDMPGFSSPVLSTAGFAYFRFHGKGELYSGSYPDDELHNWAEKILEMASVVQSVYAYFNNDYEGFAVKNALTLKDYLK
jgi:uncharacterized protein YecE (DUF72 family)